MASTVKVPLLGEHKTGTVVGVTIGGITVAGFLIWRHMKTQQAQAQAANQSALDSAQAASAYGYGDNSGYPQGYYGYGDAFGNAGFGGQNEGPETETETDTDQDGTGHQKHTDSRIRMPAVTGLTETRADSRLGSAGIHKIQTQGKGRKVSAQWPHAGVRIDPDTTTAVLHLGK